MWFTAPSFPVFHTTPQQIVAPLPATSSASVIHTKKKTKKRDGKKHIVRKHIVTPSKTVVSASIVATTTAATSSIPVEHKNQAERIQDPYPGTPQQSWDAINTSARAALVNIICDSRSGPLRPISGSGVIIDSRGVILTNAHVAQYVLLSESSGIDLVCYARGGSPAVPKYRIEVLYMPRAWVDAHVSDISNPRPTGTGEHDYALLRITGTVDGSPLPTTFPFVKPDTRETIAFTGDPVLGAAYPAEFNGVGATLSGLSAVSSVSPVGQLLTFSSGTVDLFSMGSVVEAQEGSSGGPVVNLWGYLVGVITTTSDGTTTAQRDLRAVTTGYINRDIQVQTGSPLFDFISGDLAVLEANFNANQVPGIIKQYLQVLSH